jgi:uncharacterized protein
MYSDHPKIQPLLTLGQPPNHSAWPDYLGEYGFTTDDVPALLALFTDATIDALPRGSPEIWGPVYAWRILGQLGSAAAIVPIIQSFDRLCDDDCALDELCEVIGMIGPAAIPALMQHWQQSDKEEFSLVMAMDALSEIALHHPATREQILNIFRAYMARPSMSAYTLNGLLMARLLDLKATDAIEEIRQMFALGCVDIGCAGDIEEMEIALGFRTGRSTPKPNYAQLHGFDRPIAKVVNELGDDTAFEDQDGFGDAATPGYDQAIRFELIEHALLHYGSEASIHGISELDGFFAALACAPVTIMPSTWMPAIWGGEQLLPDWESEDEITPFSYGIIHHYNAVIQDLLGQVYEPLFLESRATDSDLLIVDDWCQGFLRGLALWGPLAPADAQLLAAYLYPIRYFCTDEGRDELVAMSHHEVKQLQDSLSANVSMLHAHFFKRVKPANTTFVHTAPKTGRNDPCPCGSGKKYKKCCALH